MLDFATNAARSVLGQIGAVEHRVEHLSSVEERLGETVAAIHRAAESIERNVEVAEGLAESLPALTAAVTRLCDQLAAVLEMAAPVEAAERELETGIGRLFHWRRRRRRSALPAATGAEQGPQS